MNELKYMARRTECGTAEQIRPPLADGGLALHIKLLHVTLWLL